MTLPCADGQPSARRRSAAGFTLIEMLVAVAILLLLVASAAAAMGVARRGGATVERQAQRGQIRAAAEAILATEGRRAGYVSPDWDESAGLPFAGLPPLEITLAPGGGDALLVRYHDEHFRTALAEVVVAFTAGRDGAGRWNLYRRVGAATRQPALEGVDGLELTALYREGLPTPPAVGVWSEISAVGLELSFTWGERLGLVIVFGAPREAVVR